MATVFGVCTSSASFLLFYGWHRRQQALGDVLTCRGSRTWFGPFLLLQLQTADSTWFQGSMSQVVGWECGQQNTVCLWLHHTHVSPALAALVDLMKLIPDVCVALPIELFGARDTGLTGSGATKIPKEVRFNHTLGGAFSHCDHYATGGNTTDGS